MQQNKIKIALICFDNPFLKPMEGGKRSILSRIQSLVMLENCTANVYLLCKRGEGMAVDYKGFDRYMSFYQYSMKNTSPTMILSKLPICVNKRFVEPCVKEMAQHQYDIAIYEGEQVFAYRLRNSVKAKKHILYFHDIESEYRENIARTAENRIIKIANKRESKQFKRIEEKADHYFDAFWFISKEECSRISDITNRNCIYLPAPTNDLAKNVVTSVKEPDTLLYVGDLSVGNNFISLKWFIDEVMPKIRAKRPNAKCKVVGRINEDNRKIIEKDGIVILGYVDDINALYNEVSCIISPVLYGAGVKIKVIDALGKGQIVITTLKGIEGTELEHGKHLLVSDSADEQAQMCLDIMENRDGFVTIAENGLQFIKKYHSIENQTKIISQSINQLINELK